MLIYFIISMKRILLFFLCFTVFQYNAQMSWINGITISPSTPTELDSITVFIDLSFAYSDCPLEHKFISVLGNDIQSSSHHCQGSLASICDTRDTLLLAPLPVGTYKLIHSSTSGSGSVPCTPGFVVDDVDSIEFYVVNSALSSVTFKVDMNNVTENFTNPEINGTFNSFCGNCDTMADPNQDGIWEFTSYFPVGDTMQFKFSADNWSIEENLDGNSTCTNGDLNNTNRLFVVPNQDTILKAVCWGSCDTCLSSPVQIENAKASKKLNFKIFPNPVHDLLTVNCDICSIDKLFLYDTRGRLVKTKNTNNILISDLESGPYILVIFVEEKAYKYLIDKF